MLGRTLAITLFLLLTGCADRPGPTAPDREPTLADGNPINIFAKAGTELVFSLKFPTLATPDLEPRADGVRGTGRWVGGDRVSYHTAWTFFEHEDPFQHPFVVGARVVIQSYHANTETKIRLNDSGIVELRPQGKPPYPYEPGQVIAPDRSRRGATIELLHRRDEGDQLLARWVVPATQPENSKVRWYYQLGGLVVAEHSELGVIARVIVSGMHPAYHFRISGVTTRGAVWVEVL